jgi:transcriptional regulator with XRE-family HTH domain
VNKKSESTRSNSRDSLTEAFGAHIRRLRLERGYSMRGFANLADVEYSQIVKIETGVSAPNLLTAYKLAEALEISLKQLFDFKYASSLNLKK